ncbi:MAG: PVC-type heme-binding CxxCH protein [Candidatus Hydrogenedentota bacterium]
MKYTILAALALTCTVLTPQTLAQIEVTGPSGYTPSVAEASDEGERVIRRFQKPDDMEVTLFAAEPMLANPVSFTVDHQGRFYVAETFRHHAGVSDMRGHRSWLVEDLANRTIEERLETMRRNLGADFAGYSGQQDRIRQIVDLDRDGIADVATVFSDGYDDTLDGIGSGLLVDRGAVFYTCIPDVYKLIDTDDDGHADSKESLSTGYGVHINFLGHDSHGLRKGPDGRIYFTIGDRGFSVTNKEGKLLDYPDTGAVLRCFPDGSGLEVVHEGLRNPQELAFDAYGNLFTGDNNSDGGDQARWVYIVDGGDSGWTIGWQWQTTPNPRGPWNSEKMWHPYHEGQPAHLVPPIQNIGAGPSGLTYYPGTGMPDRYENYFFLCDFRGDPNGSLIHAIQVEEDGAGFKIADRHDFSKQALATDVDFGMDGGIYFTDWVAGWDKTSKGRIYRIAEPGVSKQPLVAETRTLLAEGMTERSDAELLKLLSHADMRVRFEAQYELADHGAKGLTTFKNALTQDELFPKLHGIWGLWQQMLAGDIEASELIPYLSDKNVAVRSQAARILLEASKPTGQNELVAMLSDSEARPRFFAAIALGGQGMKSAETQAALESMIITNNGNDPYLRHAGVMGLLGTVSAENLVNYSTHANKELRLTALLALRRLQHIGVTKFLNDSDTFIITEAARAIHDGYVPEAYPALAAFADDDKMDWNNAALARRVMNAHYRLGTSDNGSAIAKIAAMEGIPVPLREEAITNLIEWEQPPELDRINGMWRPIEKRDSTISPEFLTKVIPGLLDSDSNNVKISATNLAKRHNVSATGPNLLNIVAEASHGSEVRIAALQALSELKTPDLNKAIDAAMDSDAPLVRLEGVTQLAKLDPKRATPILTKTIDKGELSEQQAALNALGTIEGKAAEKSLLSWIKKLDSGKAPAPIQADIILAAKSSPMTSVQKSITAYEAKFSDEEAIDRWLPALEGGNGIRGRKLFMEKAETQCLRCHTIGRSKGSEVGPDLSDVGSRLDRNTILESIVFPNNTIADGFENVIIELNSGDEIAGRVIDDTTDTLVLELDTAEFARLKTSKNPHSIVDVIAEGSSLARTQVAFAKSDIKDRFRDLSSMPQDLTEFLTLHELRDLVEFLTSRVK